MNDLTQRLIRELNNLPIPVHLQSIYTLFSRAPEFAEILPEHLNKEGVQLRVLYQLTTEGKQYLTEIDRLKIHELEHSAYRQRATLLAKQKSDFESQIETSNLLLCAQFNIILPQVNILIANKYPKYPQCSRSDTIQTQIRVVQGYKALLFQEINSINSLEPKIRLLKLKHTLKDLFSALHSLNFICTELQPADWFDNSCIALQKALNIKVLFQLKLHNLYRQFTEYLSIANIKVQLKQFEQSLCATNSTLSALQLEINNIPLSEEQKQKLQGELTLNTIEHQISLYQNQITTPLSYINLQSWAQWWFSNQQYNDRQKELVLFVRFLTLTKEHQLKQIHKQELTHLIERLNLLQVQNHLIEPDSSSHPVDELRLLEEGSDLIHSSPAFQLSKTISSTPSIAEIYFELEANIPLIEKEIAKQQLIIATIQKLIPKMHELHTLRLNYHLSEHSDIDLPDISELEHLFLVLNQQPEMLKDLEKQIELCDNYLTATQQLIYLQEASNNINLDIQAIRTELNKNKTPFSTQISEIEAKLSILQDDLIAKIRELNGEVIAFEDNDGNDNNEPHPDSPVALDPSIITEISTDPILDTRTVSQSLIPETPDERIEVHDHLIGSSSALPDLLEDSLVHSLEADKIHPIENNVQNPLLDEELNKWNQQIISLLSHHPIEAQQWYLELFTLAKSNISNAPISYQYAHLIKDILFLTYHKNSIELIHSYHQICPSPSENMAELLALKPIHPPAVALYNKAQIEGLALPFKKLYLHYTQLKQSYPIEAELLLQAMDTLYKFKELIDRNPSIHFNIPDIIHDPFYQPLKRHRGFLRVWEALEDLYNALVRWIKGNVQNKYEGTSCFFKTNSHRLVEAAYLFVETSNSPVLSTESTQ